MKPIIILGKGPSAFSIKKSDKYDVAACNNAIILCEDPTYAFYNDIETVEITDKEDFSKISTLIIPTYLHSMNNPRFNGVHQEVHYTKLLELFNDGRFDDLDILLYELHKNASLRPEEVEQINNGREIAPPLDEWPGSCGVAAANFLAKFIGYRTFIFAGIDPAGGYHPIFNNVKVDGAGNPAFGGMGTAAQPSGYDADYNQMIRLIESYGGTAVHIDTMSDEQKRELDIS
jgi:hypothetical protein